MLGLLWNPKEVSTYDVAFFDGAPAGDAALTSC